MYPQKPFNVMYANGEKITQEDYQGMIGIYLHLLFFLCFILLLLYIMNETSVAFKWQQGDVLLVDNRFAFLFFLSFFKTQL